MFPLNMLDISLQILNLKSDIIPRDSLIQLFRI